MNRAIIIVVIMILVIVVYCSILWPENITNGVSGAANTPKEETDNAYKFITHKKVIHKKSWPFFGGGVSGYGKNYKANKSKPFSRGKCVH